MIRANILLIFFVCLSSCREDKLGTAISQSKNQETLLATIEKDSVVQEKCVDVIYLDNVMPSFKFENSIGRTFSKSYLTDTLFVDFSKSTIITDLKYESLEFSSWITLKKLNFVVGNRYQFHKYRNGSYTLSLAELNFRSDDLRYRYIDKDLYKIAKDSSLIDIGMSKLAFAKIFETGSKAVCDTVKVGDDSSESWYVFKKDRLHQIIIMPYIP